MLVSGQARAPPDESLIRCLGLREVQAIHMQQQSSFEDHQITPLRRLPTNSVLRCDFYTDTGATVSACVDTLAVRGRPGEDFDRFLANKNWTHWRRDDDRSVWRKSDHSTYGTVRRLTEDLLAYEFPVQKPEIQWQSVFDSGLIIPLSVSRIDLALDYPFDKESLFFDVKGRKRVRYSDAHDLVETLYFGAANSPSRFRIYDKAEQTGQPGPWTRIEHQRRKLKFGDALVPDNQFDPLIVLSHPNVDDLRWTDLAAVSLALSRPGIQRHFSYRTSKRVDALLHEYGHPLDPAPSELMRAAAPILRAELDGLIRGWQDAHYLGGGQ